jgi:ABC-2 type transport system permease protein
MILTCIFSATLAADIVAKEEREGTADFLLTHPLSRTTILHSKLGAYFTMLGTLMILQVSLAWGGAALFADELPDRHHFIVLHLNGIFLNLFFGGICVLLSLLPRKARSMTGPVVGLVLAAFIMDAFSKISTATEWLGWFSPFSYADFNVMASDYGLSLNALLPLLIPAFLGYFFTYFIYRSKDIY